MIVTRINSPVPRCPFVQREELLPRQSSAGLRAEEEEEEPTPCARVYINYTLRRI